MFTNKTVNIVIVLILLIFIITLMLPSQVNISNDSNFPLSATKSNIDTKHDTPSAIHQEKTLIPIEKVNIDHTAADGNIRSLTDLADMCMQKYDKQSNVAQETNDYLTALRLSNDSDDQLALFMQNNKTNEPLDADYVFQIPATPSNEVLLFDRKLSVCLENLNNKHCDDNLYLQAEQIDQGNAYLWYVIASIHLKQNQTDKALDALSIANDKLYYSEYYFEKIKFIEQNYHKNSNLDFFKRLDSAIGSSFTAHYTPLIDYCENNLSTLNSADLCLQMGIQLGKRGKTLIANMIGLNLQQIVYKHNFQSDLFQEVQLKLQHYNVSFIDNPDFHATSALMLFDENLARTWLNIGIAKGEIASFSETINDAKIFSQDENYRPCP